MTTTRAPSLPVRHQTTVSQYSCSGMAAIPVSELGPELRARLGLSGGTTRTRPKLSTAGSGGWNLTCVACQVVPRSAKAAAVHSADTGHRHWRYPLDDGGVA